MSKEEIFQVFLETNITDESEKEKFLTNKKNIVHLQGALGKFTYDRTLNKVFFFDKYQLGIALLLEFLNEKINEKEF